MENAEKTQLEYKDGDRFYVKEACEITGQERTEKLYPFDVIEIRRVAPDSFHSHLIKITRTTGGSATDPSWKIRKDIEPFFISQYNFNALPLGREERKGPVSSENPLSLKRAEELLSQTPNMRRSLDSTEIGVHDLMLAAHKRVQEETNGAYTIEPQYRPGE